MPKPIDLMGMELKNPIMIAAGPWSRNGRSIQRCFDAGASAVITETVTLEARPNLCPRLYCQDGNLFNTKLYSDLHLEQWEEEMEGINKGDGKLIFSIWGSSVSELSYLASKVECMGADAIEISISAPIGTRNQNLGSHSPNIHEYIKAVVDTVDIPVMVKLSYEAAMSPEFTRSIEQAGIQAVSAIDALKGLRGIDIGKMRATMPTFGGFTGPNLHPVSLATTATLKQYTPFQICGVGGITDYVTALDFIMLGAQAVQLASVIQQKGFQIITQIISDLDAWLAGNGHENIQAIRGSALATLQAFEDIEPVLLTARLVGNCDIKCANTCQLCAQSCLYDALDRRSDGIVIKSSACRGCGMCVEVCPQRKLELSWT